MIPSAALRPLTTGRTPSKIGSVLFVILLPLSPTCVAQSAKAQGTATNQVELEKLGYQPPTRNYPSNSEVAKDKSLLLRDSRTRTAYIAEDIVAVYFCRPVDDGKESAKFPQVMEAFFIDPHLGTLISHKSWPSRYRRWFNESYDTEGKIIPVRGGFLVHSGNMLYLYSPDVRQRREISLADTSLWSVRVAPGGRTIELLRIDRVDRYEAEARLLDVNTLQTLRTNRVLPGIQSVSENGTVVTKLARCLDLQEVGNSARHLCCHDKCSGGIPVFLNEAEILSYYRDGFEVISAKGGMIWNREATGRRGNVQLINDVQRSMDGRRFAVLLSSSANVEFDGTRVQKGQHIILLYDSSERVKIWEHSMRNSDPESGFALSLDGKSMAVLVGSILYVYAISS